MSEIAGSSAVGLEELLQFLYLMPVGVVKFSADGTIDLINPVASQLLLPLVPQGDLSNLYNSLAPLVPDLGRLVGNFTSNAGAILDRQRLETKAGGHTLVLSLTINRVNDTVCMAVLRDVTRSPSRKGSCLMTSSDFEPSSIACATTRSIPLF